MHLLDHMHLIEWIKEPKYLNFFFFWNRIHAVYMYLEVTDARKDIICFFLKLHVCLDPCISDDWHKTLLPWHVVVYTRVRLVVKTVNTRGILYYRYTLHNPNMQD